MSKIEVDAIDKQSGSTLTLGGSGTTVQLGTGASQTGFGREGSVNWQTGSIKTSTFTAVSGEGYFVDTSSGGVTCNLPAGSAGAIAAFADYTRTFGTNNLTISPNGSEKIGGIAEDAKLTVSGQSATFVYVDATEGWINVQETQTSQTGSVDFMAATGGTITTVCTNFKVHTFTSPGTFCVSQISTVCASRNEVSYMVIAGGGAGGGGTGAGGGAGGFREGKNSSICTYSVSPLNAPAGIAVTASGFPITVGAGGASSPGSSPFGAKGSNSIFSSITSAGGGGGAAYTYDSPNAPNSNGGSGGGGTYDFPGGNVSPTNYPAYKGSGNSPPVSPPQGQPGGGGNNHWTTSVSGGGGGGATDAGSQAASQQGGNGGDGATTSINGTPTTRAGGGGGGGQQPGTNGGNAGPGGGGTGGTPPYPSVAPGGSGTANTGGGGGGSMDYSPGSGAGGSGVVIIRYRFQ